MGETRLNRLQRVKMNLAESTIEFSNSFDSSVTKMLKEAQDLIFLAIHRASLYGKQKKGSEGI